MSPTPVAAPIDHCGRTFDEQDLEQIRETIKLFPHLSRKELAKTICENFTWYTATGSYKTTACLNLLAKLESQGALRLPAMQVEKRHGPHSEIPPALTERTEPGSSVRQSLTEVGPVWLEVVRERAREALFAEYVQRYHYLGYRQPIGCFLRYFIGCARGIIGCLLVAGAAQKIEARDRWIGWTERQRRRNLPWVINNSRYVLFPWVQVRHLASHVLGQLVRRVRADFEARWGYAPVLMETCVDPALYAGTCYRAAGFLELGRTTGRGLCRPGRQYRSTPKLFFVKPLVQDACMLLRGTELCGRREV